MELQEYLNIFRRWMWLILSAAVVGAGVSFISNSGQRPIYQAESRLLIGQFIQSPNPNVSDIRTGIDLATTYVELLETRPIMQGVIDALDLPYSPEALRGLISARIVDDTSVIVLSVLGLDPILASDIANALANELVSQSPTNLTFDQQQQITFLNNQIDILNVQVEDLQARLLTLAAQLEVATDPAEIAQLNADRNTALEQLNLAQANIGQFSGTIAQLQERLNSIQVIEEAVPPIVPISSFRITTVFFAALLAAAATTGFVFVVEYFDDTIRSTNDVAMQLAVPVLGAIVRYNRRKTSYQNMLLSRLPPMSAVAEGFRSVRTNLLYAIEKDKTATFVITSASPEEGKTVSAANLAVSMALSGMRVLIIEGDLRRPKLHDVFQLDNTIGLTTLLFAEPSQSDETPDESNEFGRLPTTFTRIVQNSGIDGLHVLTSGFIPSNPTEVLASTAMTKWIKVISASSYFDAIIIDSPPVLAAVDALVLASNISAQVILVINKGKTRSGAAKRVKEQLVQLSVPIAGVILNRIDQRDENYSYYYGYYYTADNKQGLSKRLRWLPGRNRT